MKILLDSNVALDAVLKREPFYNSAEKVIGLSQGGIGLFISASAVLPVVSPDEFLALLIPPDRPE